MPRTKRDTKQTCEALLVVLDVVRRTVEGFAAGSIKVTLEKGVRDSDTRIAPNYVRKCVNRRLASAVGVRYTTSDVLQVLKNSHEDNLPSHLRPYVVCALSLLEAISVNVVDEEYLRENLLGGKAKVLSILKELRIRMNNYKAKNENLRAWRQTRAAIDVLNDTQPIAPIA